MLLHKETLKEHLSLFEFLGKTILRWIDTCQLDLLKPIVNSRRLPETIAYVRITQQSLQSGKIEGEIEAAEYQWQFQWLFCQKQLSVRPSLGKALIKEPLERFLERYDYQLEPGSDYTFTVRAKI